MADRCALDPRADLGLGEVHFPDLEFASGGFVTGASAPSSTSGSAADGVLRARCEGAVGDRYGSAPRQRIWKRLDDELELVRGLGYASYFLTVADVTDLIRERGVRCAARGSGAGSLVNYLLGVSGIDPIRHNLLMERFLSPLRASLPDIDVDVESARRTEIYEAILDRFGGERCVCVSMMDTYRVRHAVRDVGAALGMPPSEIDTIAKAFPHIRARDARVALRELPELRASGIDAQRLDLMFGLVERLDGLPRHIAVHPCGVLLSDTTLLDRTPVEASFAGFPMSQFDKDDVEELGLLKLDVLGIRMQSSMAHAVELIRDTAGVEVDLDDQRQVRFEDDDTYRMISAAKTLGVFQIESPGQRELVGKSGIDSFDDIITDISLFRPGPVKSDMITPYLNSKQGWKAPSYLHDDLRPILGDTQGVVVFHEQVIEIIARFARITYAEADECRRALGDVEGMAEVKQWFFPRALGIGYTQPVVEGIWKILEAFASFGFCKAHAAAFALPTFQSAWLKAHWPAHFLAGVLTHDPGMYPKRLILDDARQCGITVLGLDVNASAKDYVVEWLDPELPVAADPPPVPETGVPDGTAWGIRLALAEVKGINEGEVDRIIAGRSEGQAYDSLTDFWHRAQVSRPIVERLVLAGGFDSLYSIGAPDAGGGVRRRQRITRRDLLLQVAELDRHARALDRAQGRSLRGRGLAEAKQVNGQQTPAAHRAAAAARRNSTDPQSREREAGSLPERHPLAEQGVWARASAQAQATQAPRPVDSVQLAFTLGDEPRETVTGLPEMTPEDRMRAELEILGLDVSRHVVDTYATFLDELGATRSKDLLNRRSKAELLVAGVKVATQTPPIRSGRRVVFLTLDDGTGPVDATFFEDAQGPYAATVFGSWLLVVRGELRRTGRRGVSLRATGAWELPELHAIWRGHGMAAVHEHLARVPEGYAGVGVEQEATGQHRRQPRSGAQPGAGALQRLPDVAVRRRQAGGRVRQGGRPQAVAPQPWEPGMNRSDCRPRLGRMSTSERRSSVRTGVVWDAVAARLEPNARVVDIGGGTGGFAVRLARQGHAVTVVDPSPDALAALDRRADEAGVADLVTGVQGDLTDLADLDIDGVRAGSADVVLCHGVLEVVPDPAAALRTIAGVLRPGGLLSLLVAQRHAAVVARAMAGHFQQALALLDDPSSQASQPGGRVAATPPTRWPTCSPMPASTLEAIHAVRVFADLVPGSLLDLEPGATAALVDLERAVAGRPEYLPLATQVHLLATR